MAGLRRREEKSMAASATVAVLAHDQGGSAYTQKFVTPANTVRHQKICYDEVHPRHPKDGGPLSITSVTNSWNYGYGEWGVEGPDRYGKTSNHLTRGGIHVYPSSSTPPSRNDAMVLNLGPQAYAKFSPLKPKVSGGQFIVELREMGPKFVMDQLRDFRNIFRKLGMMTRGRVGMAGSTELGSLYLAYQFGWKPFVRDLRDWIDSINKIDQQIARLRNENGKWLRRSGTLFKDKTSSSSDSVLGTFSAPFDYYTLPGGYQKTTTVTTTKCWFKGSFRYWIPELNNPEWGRFKAMQKLWGLEVTPDLVWQVMPWSWLIGWFTNLGSVITNLTSQANDNLVSNGAWLMHHTEVASESSVTKNVKVLNQITGATRRVYCIQASCMSVQDTKTRVAASPYGFGVDLPSLNAWRLSILTALGMSRLRFPTARIP